METIERIPRSPLHFYINLYCNKRRLLNKNVIKDHKLLKEATKSWLSLNNTEKQVFISKHNAIIAEQKQKIAVSLKNVKPYLKKKNHKQPDNSKNSGIHEPDEIEGNFNIRFERIPENTSVDKIMSELNFTETQQISSDTNEQSNINELTMQSNLPEPIPPCVMSGKELFVLLRTNAENGWESLTQNQRDCYHRAVLTIKRNYIKSYRSFLESLGPRELYNYYINNKQIE